MKATELRKNGATKAYTDMGAIGDLGIGKASTARRTRLVFLLKAKLLKVVLREVLVINDHDEALVVEHVTLTHQLDPLTKLLLVVHTHNHVGAVISHLLIKANRALNLVDAVILKHVARVKVNVLESRADIVFSAATLGANLVLSIVRVGDHHVAVVLASKSVSKPVVDVLTDKLLYVAVEHIA
jgi:hypothetical protein